MKTELNTFELEKKIWTHDDFEQMGWHDANIYGLSIEKDGESWTADLLFDIDYIFKWVQPVPPVKTFTFWVAPCTLIFENAFDLRMDISSDGGTVDLLEIADLYLLNRTEQEKNKFLYEWVLELQQGKIALKSYGFEQIVRKQPIHLQEQVLDLETREGISFGRKPYQ